MSASDKPPQSPQRRTLLGAAAIGDRRRQPAGRTRGECPNRRAARGLRPAAASRKPAGRRRG
jgi:hypothetical protein